MYLCIYVISKNKMHAHQESSKALLWEHNQSMLSTGKKKPFMQLVKVLEKNISFLRKLTFI